MNTHSKTFATALSLGLACSSSIKAEVISGAKVSLEKSANTSSVEDLQRVQQKLDAQKSINQQLRQRIADLEQQVKVEGLASTSPALDPNSKLPPRGNSDKYDNTAIERALLVKQLAILPKWAMQVTPSTAWIHTGSGSNSFDLMEQSLEISAGLPFGMAASLSVPYVWGFRKNNPSFEGIGNISLSLAKELFSETDYRPAIVAQASYAFKDNNNDPFSQGGAGSPFGSVTGSLSAIKRISPVAIYGGLFYSELFDQKYDTVVYQGRIIPANRYGANMGVTLAATPTISLDMGASFNFYDRVQFQPFNKAPFFGDQATAGYFTIGAGFALTRKVFLNLNASAGVTKDASDLVLNLSIPFRF